MHVDPSSVAASPTRLLVTHPRALQNGPHAGFLIDRRAIRMVVLPSAVRRGLVEAPWADPTYFAGRLVHLVVGQRVVVKAEWRSLAMALAALSDLEMIRVNHGVAVNMQLVDLVELGGSTQRLGFHVYHDGVARRTEFVRVARQASRVIRRRY